MEELARHRREQQQDGVEGDTKGDDKLDRADALFDLLESEDAYVPTRGREHGAATAAPAKRKGVRT